MTQPAAFAPDRSLLVGPGQVVKTGYVDVWQCRLACRAPMAAGDVADAYRKALQFGDRSEWPCPNGRWEGEVFWIHDGRHSWIASVMLGKTHILVAWVE